MLLLYQMDTFVCNMIQEVGTSVGRTVIKY